MPAFSITVGVWMGHSPVRPSEITFSRLANRGADFRQVVASRVVQFPPVPWQANNAYPFSYRIPLDTPFQFTPGATGLMEMRTSASTLDYATLPPGTGLVDMVYSADLPLGGWGNGYMDRIGQPCSPPGSGGNDVFMSAYVGVGNHSRAWMLPQVFGSSFPTTSLFFGGWSEQNWNGLTLPFDLSALGAPGCFIFSSLEWQFPTLSAGNYDMASADVSMPNDPRLVGAYLYVQGVHTDGGGNALGLWTSNTFRLRILPHIRTGIASTDWSDFGGWGPGMVNNLGHAGPVIQLDSR